MNENINIDGNGNIVIQDVDGSNIVINPDNSAELRKLIIDFGKFQYEQQKRDKIQKKKQHVTVLKEIRLHPNTDKHDFDFKSRHAAKFLGEGNKVKVSVVFKGRELAYKEHGKELLVRFIESLAEVSKVEHEIKFEGRTMHAILASTKLIVKKNK